MSQCSFTDCGNDKGPHKVWSDGFVTCIGECTRKRTTFLMEVRTGTAKILSRARR